MEIAVAERYARIFETKFPGVQVRIERSGAERIFSRIAQEYASRIYNVDLVNTTDGAHALAWKRAGWLAPYVQRGIMHRGTSIPMRSRRCASYSAPSPPTPSS
jgi:iron(III) transport system substrate-binding protein